MTEVKEKKRRTVITIPSALHKRVKLHCVKRGISVIEFMIEATVEHLRRLVAGEKP